MSFMQKEFTFPNNVIEIRGALDHDIDSEGRYTPIRLPRWTREQMSDIGILRMAQMGSGVRLRFQSAATKIELHLQITRLMVVGLHTEFVPSYYELRVNGEFNQKQGANQGKIIKIILNDPNLGAEEVVDGPEEILTFAGLSVGMKEIEIWLPASASSAISSIATDAEILPPAKNRKKMWVHYGSSISQSGETNQPSNIWAVNASHRLGLDIFNLGLAGQCHLDGFVARTIAELPADFITLKLGINILNGDTMRERSFVPALHNFLDIIRVAKPHTPIKIISPIWCPFHEDIPGPTLLVGTILTSAPRSIETSAGALTLKRVRVLLQDAVIKRNDKNLSYLDGLKLFNDSDVADLPDSLHPNDAGYQRMGERFAALCPEMKA
jgi:lysophospholipase L1-like esterase